MSLAAQSIIMTADQSTSSAASRRAAHTDVWRSPQHVAFWNRWAITRIPVQRRVSLNFLPGVAASTRVGNFIGARSARDAKRASHASALLSVVVGFVVMVTMMATKNVRAWEFRCLAYHALRSRRYLAIYSVTTRKLSSWSVKLCRLSLHFR